MSLLHARVDDGVDLEYEILGDGPELVWLHGLSGCVADSRPLVERLARDFRVLHYSTRGHGGSTPLLDRKRYGYDVIARDLTRMIDVARFDRPLLAGGSHGANTILRHEAHYPGRARALLLIAPGGNALRRVSPRHFLPMRALLWRAARRGPDAVFAFALGAPPGSPTIDPHLAAAWHTHDFRSIVTALRRIPDQAAVDAAALAHFAVPAHVVGWADDPVVHPLAVARRIAGLIPGATFEQVPPVAGLSVSAAADLAADVVRRWVADLSTSR